MRGNIIAWALAEIILISGFKANKTILFLF